jgi:hypothetical protein
VWIADALNNRADGQKLRYIRKQVLDLSEAFPLYAERRRAAMTHQPSSVS